MEPSSSQLSCPQVLFDSVLYDFLGFRPQLFILLYVAKFEKIPLDFLLDYSKARLLCFVVFWVGAWVLNNFLYLILVNRVHASFEKSNISRIAPLV